MSSSIISILFDKNVFDTKEARSFMKRNKLKPIKKVELQENYYHYTIKNPNALNENYKSHIKNGIEVIIEKNRSDNIIYES